MSDVPAGEGWWRASDGKWYPPNDPTQAPAPGWWLASDGKWYPPNDPNEAPGPGWWLASDGKWYPPDTTASTAPAAPDRVTPTAAATRAAPANPPGVAGWATDRPATAPVKPVPVKPVPVSRSATGPVPPPDAAPTPASPAQDAPRPAEPTAARAKSEPARPAAVKPTPVKPKPVKPTPAATTPKPARSKPTAAKPTAAKPTAAKPTTAKPAPAVPTPAVPSPARSAASAPAAKAGGGTRAATPAGRPLRSSDLEPGARPDAGETAKRRPAGRSPEDQIAVRNQSSRQDAAFLARTRSLAATRALQAVQKEAAGGTPRGLREVGGTAPTSAGGKGRPVGAKPSPGAAKEPASGPARPAPGPTGGRDASPPVENPFTGRLATGPKPRRAPSRPAAATGPEPPRPAPAPGAPGGPAPLLEVKPSPLTTDHLGDRLVIYNDRVELHDRSDRVREVIAGTDIVDVVVQRRFTGATVTVESLDGTSIVAKGLRPEQAEQVRTLIQRRTRRTEEPEAAGADAVIDAQDLLEKLVALRQAGVLTDTEFEAKKTLVGRMAARSGGSGSATPLAGARP